MIKLTSSYRLTSARHLRSQLLARSHQRTPSQMALGSDGTWLRWHLAQMALGQDGTGPVVYGGRMRIDQIAIGENPPDDINVLIEVPVGGEPIKYELDKSSGTLFVDRFLYTPMRYPGNYGFVPHTLSEDGDPIDVLVCNTREIIPGAVINCRPIGVLVMEDDGGQDEKILAVPSSHVSRRYDTITDFSQLPPITVEQVEHFFEHYKDLEPDKWVKIDHWGNADEARQMIVDAVERAAQVPAAPARRMTD